jgi:hypothetical protein
MELVFPLAPSILYVKLSLANYLRIHTRMGLNDMETDVFSRGKKRRIHLPA